MEKLLALLIFITSASFARDLERSYNSTPLRIGTKKIQVYVADDDKKREDGLMYIERLKPDTGMIFVFEDERPLSFWMKNCVMPLSVGFFNAKGILIDVQEMAAPESLLELSPPAYQSRGAAAFALEMEKGWFKKNHIAEGAKLALMGPVKSQLLTRRLPKRKD